MPPSAPRRPRTLSAHGEDRVDDWYWLRDRHDPEVIAYLRAENAHTREVAAAFEPLRQRIFEEFKARVRETDESPPVLHGGWWYHRRTVEGLEYDIHCRRAGGAGGPEGPEQVLVDENELAAGHDHFELHAFVPSPSHRLLAYGVNFDGSDLTDIRFRDLDRGEDLADGLASVGYRLAWVDDDTVVYVTLDAALRPWQAWRHRLGRPRDDDDLLYEERDERFRVRVMRTKSGGYVVVTSTSYTTTECRVLDTTGPGAGLRLVEPRLEGRRYCVDHHGDRFLIVTNDRGAVNYKLVEAPVATPGAGHWRDLVPARDDARLHQIEVLRDWVVLAEQAAAVPRLRVMRLADGSISDLEVPEEVSSTLLGPNPEFDRSVLRFVYTSLTTPRTTYDLDLATGARTLVKQEPVLGPFDPSWYRSERLWATAADGAQVPMSVVRRDGVALDGSAPAVLYGYGAYETTLDPEFSPFLLSLLDRGFVWAVAHVRGGGEMGRRWYEDGRLLAKPNSFGDFLACADHLVGRGWTAPDRLVAMGGSAGGLLVAAAANMGPELFTAVVALVPFVDVVTTMLDESLPLTVGEYDEWGDPRRPDLYRCMRSYSPYDNVAAQDYPAMLVTTGLNDTRVAFWEPAKWVAKLRATKTDDRPLLLWTDLESGHGGPSGRYGAWRERAFYYAFIVHAAGAG